jgi:voltage-gated potassium channel
MSGSEADQPAARTENKPRDERVQEVLRPFMLVAALLTIPVVAVSESHPGGATEQAADILNWVTWLAFAAELVIMLAVVPNRRHWLRTHPVDLVIVVLTPPFLPAALQSMRAVRLLRLLRLLRLAQISRQLFSLEGLRYAALLALLTVVGAAAIFVALERGQDLTAWQGIYWAATTMTTLGSNIEATTVGAQVLTVAVLIIGIAFVALLTGAVAQRFLAPEVSEIEVRAEEGENEATVALRQMREVREQLEGLEVAVQRLIEQSEAKRAGA